MRLMSLVVVGVSHGVVSSLDSRHLLHIALASVDQGLQLVVLALDHLRHRLIEEVFGLVSSGWLVAQGSVAAGGSGVVGDASGERHVAATADLPWRVVIAHLVSSDDIRRVGLLESALVSAVMLLGCAIVVWVVSVRLLDVDVLGDVLVE